MADENWGHAFLRRCGIDPDDPADVRSGYDACHEEHKRWVLHRAGDMDHETFGMLVDAILAANGWDAIPIDWPAPHLVVLPPEGLRNTLTRRPKPTFRSLLPGGQTAGERAQAITDQLMRGVIAWPHVPFVLSLSAPAAENARRLLGIGVDPDRVIDGELGAPEIEG